MDQPKIIGNIDDPAPLQSAMAESSLPLAAIEEASAEQQVSEQSEFRDITHQLKHAKRNRSKPRF